MAGTKRDRRVVRQPMTNDATPDPKTARRARIKRVAKSKQKHASMPSRYRTFVSVPMIGWQHPEPLHVKRGGQDQMLKRVLKASAHRERPISLGVHGEKCPLSIFVLPLMVDVDDFVALNECVMERDERCTCTPVILYTGAKA